MFCHSVLRFYEAVLTAMHFFLVHVVAVSQHYETQVSVYALVVYVYFW
jgi:hypothetical protein